jgi:hypothetical protein
MVHKQVDIGINLRVKLAGIKLAEGERWTLLLDLLSLLALLSWTLALLLALREYRGGDEERCHYCRHDSFHNGSPRWLL